MKPLTKMHKKWVITDSFHMNLSSNLSKEKGFYHIFDYILLLQIFLTNITYDEWKPGVILHIFHSSHAKPLTCGWMSAIRDLWMYTWCIMNVKQETKITKVIVFVIWIKNVLIFLGSEDKISYLFYFCGRTDVWSNIM